MRIICERLDQTEWEDALVLAHKVFTKEQNIPSRLLNIHEDLNPIWWCARVGREIVGIAASWKEENEWHWGRFATEPKLRGLGIGKGLAVFSLRETYKEGAEKIYVEARDVTIDILKSLGGKVTGKTEEFYGESITPMEISISDFVDEHITCRPN